MNKLENLRQHGQSIWYDNIQRALIANGGLKDLVDQGVLGMTSNPSIFERAIAGSDDYDLSLLRHARQGLSTEELYEALVIEDIREAAGILRPVYDSSQGLDGYVSLEVRPTLANDLMATVEEAKHLFNRIEAPNVLIKVPATAEGIAAIRTLIGQGINVNVTLIFSQANYRQVADAYLDGLEDLVAAGGDPGKVASVASFFVSRVDTAVDRLLDKAGREDLRGKAGIANSKVAYQIFREIFSGDRWKKLEATGARPQRPLWASTSTKDDRYPDTMYVDALIGPETVNTVPPATLKFFQDHGTVADTLTEDVDQARHELEQLEKAGVDLGRVCEQLQVEGVQAFSTAYRSLLAAIETKATKLLGLQNAVQIDVNEQNVIRDALDAFDSEVLLKRIWEHDYTLWKPDPKEITNRLGWLDLPLSMQPELPRLQAFSDQVRRDGFKEAVLLGMGGSSLAPDVFMRTFGASPGYLNLTVLDSTHPDEIESVLHRLELEHTLFIVSTKSGSTVETLSLFRTMFNRVQDLLGSEPAGSHFVGVTDPGSKLEAIAAGHGFRDLFLNDPNLGGRYSALSFFGLVPAALIGVDLEKLLGRARQAMTVCDGSLPVFDNPSAKLGALMGELALSGKDKLTFVIEKELESFADWLEQLLAESTGKEGKGILPVAHEALLGPESYRNDRLFAWIRKRGSSTHAKQMEALQQSGHPVVEMAYDDTYDLGALMYLWEVATAIAGKRLGINPFNQPNVESAKVRAREMVAAYEKEGTLPTESPVLESDGVRIFAGGDSITEVIEKEKSASSAIMAFLEQAPDEAYVALQAYLQPTPRIRTALQNLRTEIQKRTCRAVTLGFGPRFLHSTGQLHKGDAGHGMFIQISGEKQRDLPIPDEAGSDESQISFGVLIDAQVRGDWQALLDRDRRVLRLYFDLPVGGRLEKMVESL